MKKIFYIALPFLIFFLFVFSTTITNKEINAITLLTTTKNYVAGKSIALNFSATTKTSNTNLFIVTSYGKTVLKPKNLKGKLSFRIPNTYSQKTGIVSWYLIENNKSVLNGNFKITPNNATTTLIENYLGPRTILTGKDHFAMMVVVPTDSYDNPKEDNTSVLIKHQFLNTTTVETEKTKDFIAWKNIYSKNKSGKMLVSSVCDKTSTKEVETDIYPSIATDFEINYSQNHEYADGNQITTLKTNTIKDEYNNLVSDGTLVAFHIENNNKMVLKSYGTTISGIATAQILHPDHPETYTIKGYITGIAQSNTITIAYKSVINSFDYSFSKNKRTLTVGPIKSFMNQLIPDGIKVVLKIFYNNKLLETIQQESSKGITSFYLSPDYYKEKKYRFEITTLGVTKKTKNIQYVNN
ncbi:hypothetical protein [Flavobacterium sp. K5-23]|uniref:hypothetical protein n=1 Tax=Flavobacterium sp. K5-23 TaxID=2746225 RepID=UPI00200DA4E8|nr:hypothetical protein [Flavobacterium sp. K5-23]UQD55854.1 hypothetical protein FLAK523_05355 [Flavobacterium sp. K5-23]